MLYQVDSACLLKQPWKVFSHSLIRSESTLRITKLTFVCPLESSFSKFFTFLLCIVDPPGLELSAVDQKKAFRILMEEKRRLMRLEQKQNERMARYIAMHQQIKQALEE